MRLRRNVLRVSDAQRLADFYCIQLGMKLLAETVAPPDSPYRHLVLGYRQESAQAQLELLEVRPTHPSAVVPYQQGSADVYWKIGLTLPDVRRAHQRLTAAGIAVSEPQQFRDIGFLCHLQDPEGFQIELLQHDFEVHHVAQPVDASQPLGSQPTLGQITLRVTDIDANLRFYRDALGMTLLSIQPVEPYGFTLYFLAFTSDVPPNPDLQAIGNREWLWKRPYTTLELQHLHRRTPSASPLRIPPISEPGFAGLGVSCSDLSMVGGRLAAHHWPFELASDHGSLQVSDPQGVLVSISLESELADSSSISYVKY